MGGGVVCSDRVRSVAVAQEEEGGEKRLVGYVVAGGETTVTGEELQGYLKGKLPEYMVPQYWVKIGSLPLTPNGKVDRKALAANYARKASDRHKREEKARVFAALKAAGARYEQFVYDGTQHGFHNNSTPRYDEKAANLSWERALAHFRKHLA